MTTKSVLAVLLTVIGTAVFATSNDSTFTNHLNTVPVSGSESYQLRRAQSSQPLMASIKKNQAQILTEVAFDTVSSTYIDQLSKRLYIQKNNSLFGLVGYDLGTTELRVLVYDDDFNLVFRDEVSADGTVNKGYDLKNVSSQWVKIMVFKGSNLLLKSRMELN